MWKQFILARCKACSFSEPANLLLIEDVERALNDKFPAQLKSVLLETNGCFGEYDLGLIWALDRILESNSFFRTNKQFNENYMSFEKLLFFADAGNGNQFFFPLLAGQPPIREAVFVWNHEDDSRLWAAPNLEKYLDWWLSGRLKV